MKGKLFEVSRLILKAMNKSGGEQEVGGMVSGWFGIDIDTKIF